MSRAATRATLRIATACLVLAAILGPILGLAGCSTARTVARPAPEIAEPPINSLALEQCLRENPANVCVAD